MLALAMIETRAGLQAVEGIASVPQIDGLFVGPGDLGIALGLGPGVAHDHPVLAAAIQRIHAFNRPALRPASSRASGVAARRWRALCKCRAFMLRSVQ